MPSRRTDRRVVAAFAFLSGLALLGAGGCSHDVGGWRMSYASLSEARFDSVAKEDVQIVPATFDELAQSPQLEGVACMGFSRFNSLGQLEASSTDPDRTLRPLAAEKGAQLVRWGGREVAPATRESPARWEYIAVYYHGYWRPEVASAGN